MAQRGWREKPETEEQRNDYQTYNINERREDKGVLEKNIKEYKSIRSFYFKLIFGSYYFCFVQFSLFPMSKRKRGITGDVANRREAIRKRERRVVETEEERSRRLSTMAQRGQDRRVEETEEQRNSRLSDMAQRGQERRAEETEEQRKENTFWGGT
ncbi:hypothetical protein AVEN_30374-1 [Araneus ventricosus]|uniref:STPR domain-containing protein n=1 Tax=Araneus ventricosus TaxID=182803 RepID=A0A4Y2UQT3_ARAVE|nr:hypothetical protein AVEN_30374-1 [Araneus ventricosus]